MKYVSEDRLIRVGENYYTPDAFAAKIKKILLLALGVLFFAMV
jgi:hypothetical protein